MLRSLPLLMMIASLVSCSAYDAMDADFSDTDVGSADDRDTDTGPDRPYTGPTYWSVTASIQVIEGEPVLDGSLLTVSFFDAEGDGFAGQGGEADTCNFNLVEIVGGPERPMEDPPLLTWWSLSLDPSAESGCPWTVPTPAATRDAEVPQVVLGLGPMDPVLMPALAGAGLDPDAPLYGLYVLHPSAQGDREYIFGAAGTQDQYAGSDTRVDAPPLPDGTYELRTLVLLPIPEASRPS